MRSESAVTVAVDPGLELALPPTEDEDEPAVCPLLSVRCEQIAGRVAGNFGSFDLYPAVVVFLRDGDYGS